MTGQADEAAGAPEISGFRRTAILVTVTISVALYAMTITIANVSLPQMQGALSATVDQIALVITFNIVATAIATPMTGWLAARFGRRRTMIVAMGGFTVATLFCGFATGLAELVALRFVQGFFGAPLAPLAQAIVLASYPKERHGTVTAIFGMGVVLGPVFAPTLGGYLSETYSWRWVFFLMVPFGCISFAGIWAFIRVSDERQRLRLDWTGFIALAIAIAATQFMLDRGEREDWFSSSEIILEAAIALIALHIFLVQILTTDRPFIDPRLFLDRNFTVGLLLTLIFGMLMFTPIVLFPPMLQGLKGYPDSIIGALIAARGAGTLVGFVCLLFGNKLDPRIWIVLGFGLQGIAGVMMTRFDINVTAFDIAWTTFVQGLGVGFLWVPLTLVTFATLEPRHLPTGMSMFHLIRNIGSSVHVSLSIALVIHMSKVNYAQLSEGVSAFNESWHYPLALGVWNPDSSLGLASIGGEVRRQATMIGYIDAFHLYAVTALAVAPLILLVKWRRPKS